MADERRIRDWISDWCSSDLNWAPHSLGWTCLRVVKVDHHAARQRLGVRERLAYGVYGPSRHTRRVKRLDPVSSIVLSQDRIHQHNQSIQVGHPIAIGDRKSTRLNSSH